MANSSIINELKTQVITEIVNSEPLFQAINHPDIKSFEDSYKMVNKCLFRFHMNPETLKETISYLTFQVHIEKDYSNSAWIKPKLEIWIISHVSRMKVDNIPKITDNRNDYISKLLDQLLNKRSEIGNIKLYGALSLASNVEGAFSRDYLYRRMIFETKDLTDSVCGDT